MKFKSNIEVQAGIEDKDGQTGSNGQILASTGSQVDWIDPTNIVTSATDVIIECKNTSGATIVKGTPVYQTGNVGATAVIEIAVADASDEDKMAAIGLLQSDLINNAFGYVVVTGELLNITTSPIDGSTPAVGDTIYVKPGGGLTLTKPTGVNFIQNVGLVGKVSGGNAGSLTVSSIMRSNDVPTPLYIDHDNQRLGVGVTNPGDVLVVKGGSPGNIDLVSFQNNAGNQTHRFYTDSANDGVIETVTNAGVTANLIQSSGNSYFNGGNVGIGTTSPQRNLTIYESSGNAVLQLANNTSGVGASDGFLAYTDGTNVGLENKENGYLSLATNASEKMRVTSAGNVGIGNTSPVNGKLVVTSGVDGPLNTIRIQHTRDDANVATSALEIDMNLSGADTTTSDRTNRGIFVDLDSSADGDASNEHRIHGIESDVRFTGFSDVVRAGQFYAESGNITEKTAQLVGVYGQAIHDANSTNGGVSNMYGVFGYSQPQDLGDVDNAFGGYFLVDIGTNRGNADIGVTKGVEGEISINKANTITYGEMMAVSGVIDNNEGTVPNFGNQYLFKGDYQGTKGSNAWGIYTEGDKHYFSGKVGIGNTSPDEKLEVSGSGASDYPYIKISNPSQTGRYMRIGMIDSINHCIEANGGSTYLTFKTNATERMRIATDGKVGIGTTSPTAKVEVLGVDDNSILKLTRGNAPQYLNFRGYQMASNGNHMLVSADDAKQVWLGHQSSTAEVVVDVGGNVGIGTTSPDSQLEVYYDSAGNTGAQIKLGSGDAGYETTITNYRRTTDSTFEIASYDDTILGYNRSTDKTWLGIGTNVGIGTTSPLTKLHIAGTTNNNIIRIENTSTALSSGSTIGAIQFFNNDTSDDSPNVAASIYATAGASGGSGSLRFKTTEPGTEGDPATDTMIITNGGRVDACGVFTKCRVTYCYVL